MRPSILQREESISVDRNIVTLLSRATYESFPRVLRELVSNAYDADASRVSIDIYIDRDEIVVEDNGNGMTPNQFHYFLTIAARKRTPAPTPRYKRERIGQFGVGFLAAFPFCEELVVQTSAERSPITITATIPSNRYLRDRREDIEGIESIRVPVTEATDPRQTDKRFTRITLSGLTHLAQEYLSPDKSGRREMSPKEQLKWDLQDTLVLDYPPRSPIATALDQRPVGMEVYLDGEQLFRNEPPGEVLETHSTSGLDLRTLEAAGLGVRYVITSPWQAIHPTALRGMRIRVSNVGVGPRHTFGLATTHGALPRLAWLSGDIYLDRGAQEFLALDREGFTNTPAIEELNDFFRDALRRVEHKLTEIDVKIKEIEAEVGLKVHGGGPRPRLPVESRRDLIESRVQELTNRGFSVERVKGPREAKPQKETKTPAAKPVRRDLRDDPGQDGPIEIDRSSRTIRVFEDHPGLVDKLVTAQGDFDLRYDRWDYSSADWPACRLDNDLLVVNSDYPLFKSRSHGRLFLRLAANVVIVLADSANGQELSRRLLLSLAEESKDLA